MILEQPSSQPLELLLVIVPMLCLSCRSFVLQQAGELLMLQAAAVPPQIARFVQRASAQTQRQPARQVKLRHQP